jgi:hypothetical protein
MYHFLFFQLPALSYSLPRRRRRFGRETEKQKQTAVAIENNEREEIEEVKTQLQCKEEVREGVMVDSATVEERETMRWRRGGKEFKKNKRRPNQLITRPDSSPPPPLLLCKPGEGLQTGGTQEPLGSIAQRQNVERR